MMRMTQYFWIACTIVLLSGQLNRALSQQHPNLERGLGAESNQSDTIDNINLYNGNLSLVIPIGQTFNAGGNLNYKLTLVYNSNVWDFKESKDPTQTLTGGMALKSLPNPKTNSGLGWHLSLGSLYRNNLTEINEAGFWTYVGADGSEHYFWTTLRDGDQPDGKMYTRDSSYLRLTVLDCPSNPMQCNSSRGTVEFPDGQIHTFDASGRITQMRDRFNNWVNITYPAGQIVLTDTFQRTITIWLTPQQQVDRVEFPTVGGNAPAIYELTYETLNIDRHAKNTYNWAGNGQPERVNVQVLKSITLPASGGSYAFTYESDYGTGGVPGVIRSATLPTLGRYEWDFTLYRFPVNDPTEPMPAQEPSVQSRISSSDGVAAKRVFAAGAFSTQDTWLYTQRVESIGTETDPRSGTMTTVRTPAGDETVHHFNTTYDSWDYGLPYTLKSTNSDGTLFLSQEIYKGVVENGVKRRVVYVRYESDNPTGPSGAGDPRSNTRQSVERTLFLDDGNSYRTISHSNYDGLGHYRQTVTSGTFTQSEKPRTITTNYNPQGKPPAAGAWLLNTYDEQTESENGVTARRGYCFDATNGFLKQQRTMVGAAPGDKDIVVQYTRSANSRGAVSAEEYFGGDQGGAGLSACATLYGSQYRINYSYAFGSVQTKSYADQSGTGIILTMLDREIDAATGLPVAERDAAGIEDSFEYDELGRLRWVIPAPDQNNRAWVEVEYVAASSQTSLATKTIRERNQSGGKAGAVHTETIATYDGFGRVIRREELMANNVRGAVETRYNAMGWTLAVSEKMAGTPTAWTEYRDFDAFGRAQKIVAADGHITDIKYGGISGVTRTVRMGLSQNGGEVSESQVDYSEKRDSHDRLVRVIENSADGANDIIAEYDYDVGSRLRSVKVISRDGSTQQLRTFNYDNRGFLLSQVNPENGTTLYSDYDARGHARVERVGASGGPFHLRMAYDRAERIVELKEAAGSQRPLKTFTYASSATAGVWSTGKLISAVRHNYHDRFNTDVVVTQNYRYDGVGGKLSRRDTLVNTGDGQIKSFTQSWTYTNLGQVEAINYPQCQNLACTNTAGQTPVTINYAYSRGYLSVVGGFVNQTSYHPNGLVNRLTYSNGMTLTQEVAANGTPRPSRISTAGAIATAAGGNFDTGQYQYDGAGNITRIGANYYVYDRFNRLVEGTQLVGESWRQSYTYDDFGNLTQIVTANQFGGTDTLVATTSTTNNRLIRATYDAAGNQTSSGNNQYLYDSLRMIKQFQEVAGGVVNQDLIYAYTADDQRIWSYNMTVNRSSWVLRDADGKALREYKTAGQTNGTVVWSVGANYVYHGSKLVGMIDPANNANNRFIFTDHLGSPRLIANQTKQVMESHHYLPFGLERPFAGSSSSLQFTGHERDTNGGSEMDDLDYMHARYYSPRFGRFLSLDPGNDHDPSRPQSWNKYAYVRNNPVNSADPDGRETKSQPWTQQTDPQAPIECSPEVIEAMKRAYKSAWSGKGTHEAGFRVDQHPTMDDYTQITDTSSSYSYKKETIYSTALTTSVWHVHPDKSKPAPSTNDTNAVNDILAKKSQRIEMYTFGTHGLYRYDPATKRPSVMLRSGLTWQTPCPPGYQSPRP